MSFKERLHHRHGLRIVLGIFGHIAGHRTGGEGHAHKSRTGGGDAHSRPAVFVERQLAECAFLDGQCRSRCPRSGSLRRPRRNHCRPRWLGPCRRIPWRSPSSWCRGPSSRTEPRYPWSVDTAGQTGGEHQGAGGAQNRGVNHGGPPPSGRRGSPRVVARNLWICRILGKRSATAGCQSLAGIGIQKSETSRQITAAMVAIRSQNTA